LRFIGGGLCAWLLIVATLQAGPANSEAPRVRAGFKLELVYAPPLNTEGSWVSLTVDDRGRLIASDEYGALYRVTPSGIGEEASKSQVARIPAVIGWAQGLAFVNGALYVVVNSQPDPKGNGLYRVTDSNGDDALDKVELLLPLQGAGEHGQHAVVASPDMRSLFICAGNYTPSPRFTGSRITAGWGEDQLLSRLDDPAKQGTGVPAPGGWIVQTDLNGRQCELFSVGYRNIYDMAFNGDGELFTFESDMEFDAGTPWYRPPSLLHVTSGADYGWRGGDGLWPPYYPDTLPPVTTAPPGSPTGLASGAGTKFPPRYQSALFAGDWSRGTVYAIQLTPNGSSYRGELEPMAEGLAGVTDLAANPTDGALYFIVGGRRTDSKLYRLVWTGPQSTGPQSTNAALAPDGGQTIASSELEAAAAARGSRRSLERLHLITLGGAEVVIWPSLSNPDRFIRYAALTALERTDPAAWFKQCLSEPNVLAKFTALIALARRGEPAEPGAWADAVLAPDFPTLSEEEQQTVLRAAALGVMRFKSLTPAMHEQIATGIARWHPTRRPEVDRELAKLLVRLKSPTIVGPLAKILVSDAGSEEAIDAAVALSAATTGWTPQTRTAVLDWFDQAAQRYGHRSFYPYLIAARARFIEGFSSDERRSFVARLAAPVVKPADESHSVPRRFVKAWTVDEVVRAVNSAGAKSDSAGDMVAGRRLYSKLSCAECHSMGGFGAAVGPDLTNVGRRYTVADLARAIVEPSHEIPDLYRQTTFVAGGRSITGRLTNMTADTVSVTTDLRDPASVVKLRRHDIESQKVSPVSPMPAKLLDTLDAAEIASLFAFLRQGPSSDASPSVPAQNAPK
jgi:putative heme-binding domain-containing protein